MRLGFRIAARFLKSNKGQTILIILGIAIGVSVQIFIGALIQGLQQGLVEKTVGNSSQITISSINEDRKINDYNNLMEEIQSSDSRIVSISSAADYPAFIEYSNDSKSILIRGLELDQADPIYHISDQMVEGTYPKNSNEIILGIAYKEEFGLNIGDEVTITTTAQKTVSYTVVGFFDFKVSSVNSSWGITTLAASQDLFDIGASVTSIEMQVDWDNVFSADKIADNLSLSLSQKDLKIDNWKDQNEQLLSGLQGQSISSIMIQVFVLISVILGIASVLAITVLQKSKQIGILKAMGIRNNAASFIFLFEGLILGVFGALLGILFGLGLSFSFMTFALNADGTPVVNILISPSFIISSGIIAIAVSVIASLIPAIRSRGLNPIDIIRNN